MLKLSKKRLVRRPIRKSLKGSSLLRARRRSAGLRDPATWLFEVGASEPDPKRLKKPRPIRIPSPTSDRPVV